MGLPSILILFKQKAITAVKRSQQGIVGIILRDETKKIDFIKDLQLVLEELNK